MSDDQITVPREFFYRMARALVKMEKYCDAKEAERQEWLNEAQALELLGCSQRQLYRIKGTHIAYKAIGRKHQYSKNSIERFIKQSA